MRWYDKPKQVWWYRWLFHAWLMSWNLNDALYRVSRGVRVTRPLMYNTKGRATSAAIFYWVVVFAILPVVLFGVITLLKAIVP